MNCADYPKGNFVKLSNFEKIVLFPSFKCWNIVNQLGIAGLILQGTQACQGKNLIPVTEAMVKSCAKPSFDTWKNLRAKEGKKEISISYR